MRLTFSDLVVGLPAGLLIFMSTLMFSALLRSRGAVSDGLELALLAGDAALVGWLIRLSRKAQARATALASGLIAALAILFVWLKSPANASLNPLVFGLPGLAVTIVGSYLTASRPNQEKNPTP